MKMARDYTLDAAAAKEANSGGKRITEPGEYIGTFKQAWYEVNQNGTESVNFTFLSEGGQEAGPLALYTHNGKGEELPSYKTFNAILACMKQRTIAAKRGNVTLWDYDAKAEVSKQKDVYPTLAGPRIGLVLTSEDYDGRNGVKARIVINTPFNADTRQVAEELLNNKAAAALDSHIDYLTRADRWHKPLKASAARSAEPATGRSYDDVPLDDDIPF